MTQPIVGQCSCWRSGRPYLWSFFGGRWPSGLRTVEGRYGGLDLVLYETLLLLCSGGVEDVL
jgi:hypothetical protein